MPSGGLHHTELLLKFSDTPSENCTKLVDDTMFEDFKALLKFRHYVIHGYSFQLDWNIIKHSVKKVDNMISKFMENTYSFLNEC